MCVWAGVQEKDDKVHTLRLKSNETTKKKTKNVCYDGSSYSLWRSVLLNFVKKVQITAL